MDGKRDRGCIISGPSYVVGLVGWLDRETLTFHAHCGTECEYLYALDLPSGDLMALHVFGPRFYVQPGNPWIVAQHGPSGRVDFTLVQRDSATVVHQGMTHPGPPASAAITRTLPLPRRAGSAFVDWVPASLDAGGGQRLLAVAWERGWIPLEESPSNLYLWDVQADTVSLFAPDVVDSAWSPCGRYVALLVPGEPVVQDGQYAGMHPAAEDARVYSVVVLDIEAGQVQFSAQDRKLPWTCGSSFTAGCGRGGHPMEVTEAADLSCCSSMPAATWRTISRQHSRAGRSQEARALRF